MTGWNGSQRPWEGPHRCKGTTNDGSPCSNYEIDGLEYCFWHVPDDLLEEAEEITGMRRCREPGCRYVATEGTQPPVCKNHGANLGSVISKQAAARVVDQRVMDRFAEIMSRDGERLLNPPRLGDPFTELLALAAEVKAMKDMLREVVSVLKPGQWRYAGKSGEQARAEIIMLERAQERLARILVDIIKLGIEDRLAGVEERTLDLMERALAEALRRCGADLGVQDRAREILRQELPVLAE